MISIRKIFCNSGISPFVIQITPKILNTNQTKTVTISGKNFDADTTIEISGWTGTINSINVVNPETIEVNITAGSNIGNFDVILKNQGGCSNEWSIDLGIGSIIVQNVPNGEELPLKVSSSNGAKYSGVAFGKSERNKYKVFHAFDGDSGTTHYANKYEESGHYVGIIMSQPTLLTKVGYNGEHGSTPFKLEGSNDTTDGTDGTWVDLGDYNLTVNLINIEANTHVYNAYRVVWTNPTHNHWANAREIIFFGRQ